MGKVSSIVYSLFLINVSYGTWYLPWNVTVMRAAEYKPLNHASLLMTSTWSLTWNSIFLKNVLYEKWALPCENDICYRWSINLFSNTHKKWTLKGNCILGKEILLSLKTKLNISLNSNKPFSVSAFILKLNSIKYWASMWISTNDQIPFTYSILLELMVNLQVLDCY